MGMHENGGRLEVKVQLGMSFSARNKNKTETLVVGIKMDGLLLKGFVF